MNDCQQWKECVIYYTQLIRKDVQQRFGEEPVIEERATEQSNIIIDELAKLDAPPEFFIEELLKEAWRYANQVLRRDINADLPAHIRGIYHQ